MNPNENVRYRSPDGKVTLAFIHGSPFDKDLIEDGEIVTVGMTPGQFMCNCFINGKLVPWPGGSGADHDVPKK
jgi:hypothetical protein